VRGPSIATNAYSDFLDLLPEELPGSGIAVISDNGETFESIVEKALRRWWDDPTLSPKAPPPWMAKRR
jgi:hypothetical protein